MSATELTAAAPHVRRANSIDRMRRLQLLALAPVTIAVFPVMSCMVDDPSVTIAFMG